MHPRSARRPLRGGAPPLGGLVAQHADGPLRLGESAATAARAYGRDRRGSHRSRPTRLPRRSASPQVPVTAIGFSSVVPPHLRLPMFYSLECGWACFLSYTSNQQEKRERMREMQVHLEQQQRQGAVVK